MVGAGAPGQEAISESAAPASQSFSVGGNGGAGGAGGTNAGGTSTGNATGTPGENVDGAGGGGGGSGTGLIKVYRGALTGNRSPAPS